MAEDDFLSAIQGIRRNEATSTTSLYRLLYRETFSWVLQYPDVSGQAEDIFQEAFFVLIQKVKRKRADQHEDTAIIAKEYCVKLFKRLLEERIYSIEHSVFRVVEGVRQKVEIARRQLGRSLISDASLKYAQKLQNQNEWNELLAEDILQECAAVLFERIDSGKFTLDPDSPNSWNKNRLFKFFYQTIRRKIYANQKKIKIQEINEKDWPDEQIEWERGIAPEGLYHQAREVLNLLDAAGRFIIKETYMNKRSPKQIASLIPFDDYRSTEAVVRKKTESLNSLRDHFSSKLSAMDSSALDKLQAISRFVLEKLLEPCKTILQNALPPLEKSLEEISKILSQTRPVGEVENLKTPDQIKKRKYKCLQALQESLWDELLQTQKN